MLNRIPFPDRHLIFRQTLMVSLLACSLYLVAFASRLRADAPAFEVRDGTVNIAGIGTNNPILYDNDWWFDVFDNNYLWAQASLGSVNLRGNIVSRDMWDWQQGYQYSMQQSVDDAHKALKLARDSGLKNIPDITLGSAQALERPTSGRIEDTLSQATDGSRLIVAEAGRATAEQPLLIITGGPLTTVANALLTNPEIASKIIVFGLTVNGGYNGKDGWSVYIVTQRCRYVDWGGGDFWDQDSVFRAEHFEQLPDNDFTHDMKRFIRTDLGRANQLGDGAPLVWLFQPKCWNDARVYNSRFDGQSVQFEPASKAEQGSVLVIPKAATNLEASRNEFFRVLTHPMLFP